MEIKSPLKGRKYFRLQRALLLILVDFTAILSLFLLHRVGQKPPDRQR